MLFSLRMPHLWRRWLPGLIVLLIAAGARAQTPLNPGQAPAPSNAFRCAFDSLQEAAFARQPGSKAAYQQFLTQAKRRAAQEAARGTAGTDVVIPVVVHIMFNAANTTIITDAQVQDALRIANLDFSKSNADTTTIIPPFQARSANAGIQFRLAQIDPSGDCTTGITRNFSPFGSIQVADDPLLKRVVCWDPTRYLNVWVVPEISNALRGLGGYAYLPCTVGPELDGIVIIDRQFGSIGTSSGSNFAARTFTHELGHYLGLRHTWGGSNNVGQPSNCGIDDGIDDTPNTIGVTTCNLAFAPCTDPQTNQPILANTQNYMDYSPCACMFTAGQRAVMRAALTLGCRSTLVSAANLVATGTNDGYVPPAGGCGPPTASIGTDRRRVCVNQSGGPRLFIAYGSTDALNAAGARYQWSFPGGTPATGTQRTERVSYATPGPHDVTLTITPAGGTPVTRTERQWMLVDGPGTGLSGPVAESFENPGFPANFSAADLRNWIVDTTYRPLARRWRRVSGNGLVAANGAACLSMPNTPTQVSNPNLATLTSPALDLSALQGRPVQLSFRTAGAPRPNVNGRDELVVQYGKDCEVWSNVTGQAFNAFQLYSPGQAAQNGFVPTSAQQWTTHTLTLDPQYIGAATWVRFSFTSYGGNPFYLDDVRIQEPGAPLTTRNDELARRGIGVYPNPLTAETAVHFTLAATERAAVRLTDMLGREVSRIPAKTYGAGAQAIRLAGPNGRALAAGSYVVHLTLGEQTFTTKLLVQ